MVVGPAGEHRPRRGEPLDVPDRALAARPRRAAGALSGVKGSDSVTHLAAIGAGAWGRARRPQRPRQGAHCHCGRPMPCRRRLAAPATTKPGCRHRLPPPALAVTSDSRHVANSRLVLLAVPARPSGGALAGLGTALRPPVVICAKGLDIAAAACWPSEVLAEAAPDAAPMRCPARLCRRRRRGLPPPSRSAGRPRRDGGDCRSARPVDLSHLCLDHLRGVADRRRLKMSWRLPAAFRWPRLGESARAALTTRPLPR